MQLDRKHVNADILRCLLLCSSVNCYGLFSIYSIWPVCEGVVTTSGPNASSSTIVLLQALHRWGPNLSTSARAMHAHVH